MNLKVRLLFAIFVLLYLFVRPLSAELMPSATVTPLNFIATITAYSSTRRQTSPHPHITASGKRVSKGTVACPRRFPFGTKVSIAGKPYICRDRLNIKYDNRFDIWKPNTKAARVFGKRKLPVVITDLSESEAGK